METASGEITDSWTLTSDQPSMEFMLRDSYAHLLGAECGLEFALPMSFICPAFEGVCSLLRCA